MAKKIVDLNDLVSPKFSFIKEDIKSILKGALIAGGGAFLTYIISSIMKTDFGPQWTPIIVALCSITLNALRKFLEVSKY